MDNDSYSQTTPILDFDGVALVTNNMQRDLVRRSKRTTTRSSPKRSVTAAVRSAPARSKKTRKSSRSANPSRRQPLKTTVLTSVIVVLLVLVSLWYGVGRIFVFVTRASGTYTTLLVQSEVSAEAIGKTWLLVEGGKVTPRHYSFSSHSELLSGMNTGSTWSQVSVEMRKTESPEERRMRAGQALGIPIDQIIEIDSSLESWSQIRGTLRNQAISSLKSGAIGSNIVRFWLVARTSEGDDKVRDPAAIVTQLSRQNRSAISSQENCPIALLNNSGKVGFASLVGKIIEQNGGTVLRIANALSVGESETFKNQSTTTLLLRPEAVEECATTIETIKKLVPVQSMSEDEKLVSQYRSNLILVLGFDAQLQSIADDLDLRQ